jgi:hypothetical protein
MSWPLKQWRLLICNHQVASSKPAVGTSRIKHLAQPTWLGFLLSVPYVSAV